MVSVKIGGGADLHDMDSYEVLLQIIAVYFFANQVRPESGNAEWGIIPWPVLVLVIIIPFVFPLDYVGNWVKYNNRRAQADIKTLQAAVAPAAAHGGEVLFISERQLITFDYIKGVTLVPDDEIVELMEIAMSNNQSGTFTVLFRSSSPSFCIDCFPQIEYRHQNRPGVF